MQGTADTETTDYTFYARCLAMRRLAINWYTYCGVVGSLKCEGCSAKLTLADSSAQCTCQFICLSALHTPRYIQYLLQKIAHLDLGFIFS